MGCTINSAFSILNFLKTESGLFHLLFVVTVFVNKYVLSVLGFTYPTVYQGWQTLVGAFILLYLRPNLLSSNEDSNKLTCKHFVQILPSLLIYVGFIICGSKALSTNSVPLFICAQNVSAVCFLMCTLKTVPLFEFLMGFTGLVASLFIFFYAGLMESYHPWLIFYIISSTILDLVNHYNDTSREISRLYYRNIFSFVILMPCSLYLGEAFSALKFKYFDQIGFYMGCFISGISGIFLQLAALKLAKRRNYQLNSVLIRIPTLLLSLVFFDNSDIPDPLWMLMGIQMFTTVIFIYNTYSIENKTIGQESLI